MKTMKRLMGLLGMSLIIPVTGGLSLSDTHGFAGGFLFFSVVQLILVVILAYIAACFWLLGVFD